MASNINMLDLRRAIISGSEAFITMLGEFSKHAHLAQSGVAVGGGVYMIFDNPLNVTPKMVVVRGENMQDNRMEDFIGIYDIGGCAKVNRTDGNKMYIGFKIGNYSGSTASQTLYLNSDKVRIGMYPGNPWDDTCTYEIDVYA